MIEQSTVDGVTAVFTQRPGPTVIGLSFRVGMADETLATRGITHMVEHLALHRAGLSDYHANGSTGGSVTTFHVGGKTERAVEFIELACRSLNDLPLEPLGSVQPPGRALDPADLLPGGRRYYTFLGSLSTPPCSEDVLWLVFKQTQQVSNEQLSILQRLYPPNARPVQPANGRIGKESREARSGTMRAP